ncbi:MAG: DUF2796 domain-containing protein [Burkholderiales bacterium]|nr:DUF2796 domain-containing protein [Burkholderiales bacterium]
MNRPTLPWLKCCVATALACACAMAWAAGKAHEHGALRLDVAIEGNKLTIAMEAPLDNLLGFERAPRTDAERKAAAEVLARLRSPAQGRPLFATDVAAQCTLSKAEVLSPVLEPAARADARTAAGTQAATGANKEEHADLEASYEFSCAQPGELRSLDVGLFDAYKRMQRIDVQVAGPKGQSKVTLRRPARSVKLAR